MKALRLKIVAAAVVVALGANAAAHGAAPAAREQGRGVAKGGRAASVSGFYSGALLGTIMVGGQMVVLPKNVAIVSTDGRVLAPGASVSNRPLHVSGQMRGDRLVAGLVIVADGGYADYSQETLPESPPDSRGR